MNKTIDHNTLKHFIEYELGGNSEVIARLTHIFLQQIEDLKTTPIQELDTIAKQSHKLKTSAHSFGALPLIELIISVEQAAKKGESATVQTLISEIDQQHKLISSELAYLTAQILNKGA